MKKLTKADYFAYIGAAAYLIMFIHTLITMASYITSFSFLTYIIRLIIEAIAYAAIAIMLISKKRSKILLIFLGIFAVLFVISGFSVLFYGNFISNFISIFGMASAVFLFIFVLKNFTQPPEKSVGFNTIWFLPAAFKIVSLALSAFTAQSTYSFFDLVYLLVPIIGLFFLCYWIKAETDKLAAASAGDEFDSVPKKMSEKDFKIIFVILFFTVALIIAAVMPKSSSSKRKWSDLSDQEKQNAKWAYEAQQAINDINENK